ncbi:MAG: hypothetical protein JXR84_27870 [Anaerolineae bacterium]|nr:hypothetical protein [Anaerolineae bacterium]
MEQILRIDTSPQLFFEWLEQATMYLDPNYPHHPAEPTYRIILQPSTDEKYTLEWAPGMHSAIPFLMRRHQPYYDTVEFEHIPPMTLLISAIALFDSPQTATVQNAIWLYVEERKPEGVKVTLQCKFNKVNEYFLELLRSFADRWEHLRKQMEAEFLPDMLRLAKTETEREEYEAYLIDVQVISEPQESSAESPKIDRSFRQLSADFQNLFERISRKLDVLIAMQESSPPQVQIPTSEQSKTSQPVLTIEKLPPPPDITAPTDEWFEWFHLITEEYRRKDM